MQTLPSDATVDGSGAVSAGATKPGPPTKFTTASMAAGWPGQWSTNTEPTGMLTSIGTTGPGNPFLAPVYPNVELPNPAGVGGDDEPLPSGIVAGDFDRDGRTDVAAFGVTQPPRLVPPARPCRGIEFRTVLANDAGAVPVPSGAPGDGAGALRFATGGSPATLSRLPPMWTASASTTSCS